MKNKTFRYNWSTEKEYQLLSKSQDENRVQCKHCGRKIIIPANKDSDICSWCHRKVNNTTRNHFIYKMRNILEKKEGK